MKRSEQDRLLREIVTGDELADFRQASLEHAVASMRQRQQHRRMRRTVALALLPLLALSAIVFSRPQKTSVRQIAFSNPVPLAVSRPRTASPEVKVISDEELFALFPGQPMALIGKPGQQQLVFLDKLAKRAAGRDF